MKKHNFWIFGLCLFLLGTVQAQNVENKANSANIPQGQIPTDPNVKIGKLENGLTYYIRNNGKPEDKVELRLVVNAGSILENDDQQGLAHFMEHMNFNGTTNFQKNELVDYLQSIGVKFGADLNAYTSFDETVYILPIPSDDPEKLEKGFQILEDWAHNTTLTEEAIDGERGVVLEEYRLGLGPDKRMLQEYLPKMLYGSKYAERLPIGKKDVLENFDYETLRNFYNDWYRPDLMAVVAVGDLDVATLEQKIKDHFGRIEPAKNAPKREEFDLPNHEETFITVASDPEAPFSRVQVMYKDTFKSPAAKTTQDYKDLVVRSLFSTMLNNRLNELRNAANPPFIFGYSYYGGTYARDKKAYQSVAQTSETGQLTALQALLEENERVKRFGFQEGELERAKKELIARMEKAYKDRDKIESGRIVGEYINNYLEEEPIPGIEWEYDFYQKVLPSIELKDVNGLIKNFIHPDNRVIILTGPEKEGLELVKEDEVLALLEEVENAELTAYEDEAVRSELLETKPQAGTIVSEETNADLDYKSFTLSNGAKVTYKITDFKNDEVLFSAFSYGGTSLYSDEDYLNTVYANGGLSQAGIGGLSLNDMNKMMSGKIVGVSPYISSSTEGFRGQAAPKDLETLFQQVYLYFTGLNKDEEAYNSFISKQKSFLGNLMANPNYYYQNEIGKVRNEGNPRFSGFPTPEKLDEADYDLAYAKYQERFADAGDFNFYFVGNIDEAKLKEFAKTYIGSLPGKDSNETFEVPEFRVKDEYQKVVVNKGTDPKSSVQIVWVEETDYDADEALELDALGEVLTIKLIEQLREEIGGVYGVGANGNLRKYPYGNATFSISFPCGPDNVEKLTEAALAETEKLKENGPTAEDLAKVKETYLQERKDKMQQNGFWLSVLQESDEDDMDISRMMSFEERVQALTAEELQEVANKYLDANYFMGVLMPEETE
ncbi:M16 family metallopeptidase [Leeuwenhoekiella nanhaiensis]|uniref:Peptidase M16 n=1 Tax=Leeuwenhoekiella nanhaiensis TaxID=1655491 RepID=A0A2G1VMU1_9FLAO|nr:insulinase family protein [Leeuwenhoekiella nanhaiensis]PHQ28085.1 peptidase M16 [Leeuwenhoekiella nanhaiensis]